MDFKGVFVFLHLICFSVAASDYIWSECRNCTHFGKTYYRIMHLFGEEAYFCPSPGRDVPLNALVVDKAVSTTECTSFGSRLTPIRSWERYVMNSTAVQGQAEYLILKAVSSFRELPESTEMFLLLLSIIFLELAVAFGVIAQTFELRNFKQRFGNMPSISAACGQENTSL